MSDSFVDSLYKSPMLMGTIGRCVMFTYDMKMIIVLRQI